MERYTKSDIPSPYPRVVDLLPIMSLQRKLDGDLRMTRFVGEASVGNPTTSADTPTGDPRLVITVHTVDRRKRNIVWDSGNLKDTITQKDIWNSATNLLGMNKPEMVSCEKRLFQEVPSQLSDAKEFDGMDVIHSELDKIGNYFRSMRERFGLEGLSNPRYLIEDDCRTRDYWEKDMSSHIRSVMKMTKVLATGGSHSRGWSEMFKPRIDKKYAFPPMASTISRALIQNKWWTDVGIPVRMLGHVDGTKIQATVYHLYNHDRIIAI